MPRPYTGRFYLWRQLKTLRYSKKDREWNEKYTVRFLTVLMLRL